MSMRERVVQEVVQFDCTNNIFHRNLIKDSFASNMLQFLTKKMVTKNHIFYSVIYTYIYIFEIITHK
jgi:hypothetical protein